MSLLFWMLGIGFIALWFVFASQNRVAVLCRDRLCRYWFVWTQLQQDESGLETWEIIMLIAGFVIAVATAITFLGPAIGNFFRNFIASLGTGAA